jgi:hypothetical protein
MRVDDRARRTKVETVRKWIYESGMVVTSTNIKAYLGPQSLVPTRVSCIIVHVTLNTINHSL